MVKSSKVLLACILLGSILCIQTVVTVLADQPIRPTPTLANSFASKYPEATVYVNWESVAIGQILAQGHQDGSKCLAPPLKIHIPAVSGSRRFLQTLVNEKCQTVVVGRDEIFIEHDTQYVTNRKRVEGSMTLSKINENFQGLASARIGSDRRIGNLMLSNPEVSHGHVFLDKDTVGMMEVHMAYFFGWDGDFATFDHLALDPPTFVKNPYAYLNGYDGWDGVGTNCIQGGVGEPIQCTHAAGISVPDTSYQGWGVVTTFGSVWGGVWCDFEGTDPGTYFHVTTMYCDDLP